MTKCVKDLLIEEINEENSGHFDKIQENLKILNNISASDFTEIYLIDESSIEKGILKANAILRNGCEGVYAYVSPINGCLETRQYRESGRGVIFKSKIELIDRMLPIYEMMLSGPYLSDKYPHKIIQEAMKIIDYLSSEKAKLVTGEDLK